MPQGRVSSGRNGGEQVNERRKKTRDQLTSRPKCIIITQESAIYWATPAALGSPFKRPHVLSSFPLTSVSIPVQCGNSLIPTQRLGKLICVRPHTGNPFFVDFRIRRGASFQFPSNAVGFVCFFFLFVFFSLYLSFFVFISLFFFFFFTSSKYLGILRF